jgi:erythrin-vacuolar iron transport family protein
MRAFDSLSEREILALAISLEEEDERVYADFAEGLRESFPASAAVFDGMRADETTHRQKLLSLYRERFGEHPVDPPAGREGVCESKAGVAGASTWSGCSA